MEQIVLCKLENWIERKNRTGELHLNGRPNTENKWTADIVGDGDARYYTASAPVVIYGPPCEVLLELQQKGYCVLAEFAHLQGLSEEELAEAFCKEKAVDQYEHVTVYAEELPQAYLRRIWCQSQGLPVIIAETERLLVRESLQEDAEAFYKLYQDEDSKRYLEPIVPEFEAMQDPAVVQEAYRHYIQAYRENQYGFYEYGMWTVVDKETGLVAGRMGLELQWVPEIVNDASAPCCLQRAVDNFLSLGYSLLPEYRGRGYVTEACLAILGYAKECTYAEKVMIKVHQDNVASLAAAEKICRAWKEQTCRKQEEQDHCSRSGSIARETAVQNCVIYILDIS